MQAASRSTLQHILRLKYAPDMRIEIEREEDGRWLAEISDLPGVLAYGETEQAATSKVKALALRVLADRLEHGEDVPKLTEVFTAAA
jgi:predicted RNase H-like HicB family nuclease